MPESRPPAEGRRQQLLEKLRVFEEAAEKVHPEMHGTDAAQDNARFRDAAEDLQTYLSHHLSSRETLDWAKLPDSGAEIAVFANELKTEHRKFLNELAQLARLAEKMEEAPDRADAASRLRQQSRALALRIARHAGEEEASLGNYL
ncbi:MAG TPA: hypothetical protein VNJ12_13045 [Candidatus Dormibacteraeota bacterium]|nr:hypothetical protein [Candidatus Dormibacteraeota bacterium]